MGLCVCVHTCTCVCGSAQEGCSRARGCQHGGRAGAGTRRARGEGTRRTRRARGAGTHWGTHRARGGSGAGRGARGDAASAATSSHPSEPGAGWSHLLYGGVIRVTQGLHIWKGETSGSRWVHPHLER